MLFIHVKSEDIFFVAGCDVENIDKKDILCFWLIRDNKKLQKTFILSKGLLGTFNNSLG